MKATRVLKRCEAMRPEHSLFFRIVFSLLLFGHVVVSGCIRPDSPASVRFLISAEDATVGDDGNVTVHFRLDNTGNSTIKFQSFIGSGALRNVVVRLWSSEFAGDAHEARLSDPAGNSRPALIVLGEGGFYKKTLLASGLDELPAGNYALQAKYAAGSQSPRDGLWNGPVESNRIEVTLL